jgi:hypothetical protein
MSWEDHCCQALPVALAVQAAQPMHCCSSESRAQSYVERVQKLRQHYNCEPVEAALPGNRVTCINMVHDPGTKPYRVSSYPHALQRYLGQASKL